MAETTTTLSSNLHSYYFKRLLESAEKNLKIIPLGKKLLHPRRTGKDSYLLKWGNVAHSTAELSEGVTPTSATIDSNKYTVSLKQYGQYIPLSDLILATAIDPVMEDVSDRLGYAAALSADTIVRDVILAGATASIQYVGAGNTVDNDIGATEIFVAKDSIKGVRLLKSVDAPKFDDGLYVWLVNDLISMDIQSDTAAGGFIELNKYVSGLSDKPLKGEVGKVYGAKVVETNNIAYVANTGPVNVYRSMMMAKEAFAFTSFDSDFIEMIVKQPGSSGVADPLNQVGTAGYKMQFGCSYIGGTFSGEEGASPELCIQVRGACTGG